MKCAIPLPALGMLVLFAACPASSQDSFMVISVKGKVEVSSSRSGRGQPAKVGDVLGSGSWIRTSYGSYAKLMMNGNRLVAVDERSHKPLSELASAAESPWEEGRAGRMLQSLAEHISRSRIRSEDGYAGVRSPAEVFEAVFPVGSTMSSAPLFEWIDGDSAGSYDVLLLDENFNTLARRRCAGSRFETPRDEKLTGGKTYHWQVTRISDGEASNVRTFRVLDPDTAAAVAEETGSIGRELELMGADEAAHNLILAVYYDLRGLAQDAFHAYRRTIEQAPGVAEYRDMLILFLKERRLHGAAGLLPK